MRGWRALLLTMVLFTGCLGGGETPDDVSAASAEGEAAAGPAPADARAEGGAGADPSSDAAAATARPPTRVRIALEGSIPAFANACVFAPVMGQCFGTGGDWNNAVELEISGNATSATITLEWAAASPTTEELFLYFASYDESDFIQHGSVAGSSPLVIDLPDAFELPAGMTHRIAVAVSSEGTGTPVGGAFAGASPAEQTFTLSGEILLSAPANP